MKLRIEKAVYGGAGLGHAPTGDALAGKTIFVPLTLPGELIECAITDDRRSFANAQLTRVVEASSDRRQAPCEYFPVCGACHYQHASYAAQLAIKRTILAEILAHAGFPFEASSMHILAGEPLAYRNRVRLHIRFGDFALCYREAASHRDVAVGHCPIAAPLLQQAIAAFPDVALHSGIDAGLLNEIELFTNSAQDTLLISFWTDQGATATRALPLLCDALQEALPALRGALLFQSESQKGLGRQQAAWGEPSLRYAVGTNSYRVSAGSFFQVNRFLLPEILHHVIAGQTGQTAWDLYAGAGLFAGPLGKSFAHVTAVEQAASSVRDLRANLDSRNHHVVASSTLDFLEKHKQDKPDLVVVDPPRAGLGKEVTQHLSRIGPANLTYISCDPATLARDLQWLLHSGYQLSHITLIDLFPQTFHLETIAQLTKQTS